MVSVMPTGGSTEWFCGHKHYDNSSFFSSVITDEGLRGLSVQEIILPLKKVQNHTSIHYHPSIN